MENREIKIGIFGFGGRGNSLVAPLLSENMGAQITTIIDTDIPRAKFYMQERIEKGDITSEEAAQVRYVGSFTELKKGEVDLLLMTASEKIRTDFMDQAVDTGAHLFIEKGISHHYEGVKKVVAALKRLRPGQQAMMGFNLRYHPTFLEMKQLIESGKLGRILYVHYIERLSQRHGSGFYRRWHRDIHKSGGMLITKSCHDFDAINYFLGKYPQQVFSDQVSLFFGLGGEDARAYCHTCDRTADCAFDVLKLESSRENRLRFRSVFTNKDAVSTDGYTHDACVWRKDTELHDTNTILFRYPGGVRANYTQVLYSPNESRDVTIFGDRGTIFLREKEPFLEYRDFWNQQIYKIAVKGNTDAHGGADTNMIRALYRLIFHGDQPRGTVRDGVAALCMAEGAYASARQEAWVDVEALTTPLLDLL